MVGMTYSAPWRMPVGQREVTVFISEDHLFALSAGRRYDVISIEDPTDPQRVGRFELETPGHSVHDVWVSDGVAFSSNWTDGVVAVDVGGGGRGGHRSAPSSSDDTPIQVGGITPRFPTRARPPASSTCSPAMKHFRMAA